jgi:hypothetical protein
MKREDLIKNDERVVAHHQDKTASFYTKWSYLKNDFIAGKITNPIVRVYSHKTRKSYEVTYQPTKGFKYREIIGV